MSAPDHILVGLHNGSLIIGADGGSILGMPMDHYIRKDASDAAIAVARTEAWEAAIEAVKVEIKEWLALPAIPPKNPRAEVYDEACHNIMRFVCDLKPPAEAQL